MCVIPFTAAFSHLTPEEFTHGVLVADLHAAAVVVGENSTYGHRAAGTVASLTQEGRRFGFAVEGIPLAGDDAAAGAGPISSTHLPARVAAGGAGGAPRG